MAWVKDKETGELQQVSDERLAGLDPTKFDAIVTSGGEVGRVPLQHLFTGGARGAGMQLATDEQVAAQRDYQKYGQGAAALRGAFEAVARGATINVSDIVAPFLGADPEGIRKRQQYLGGLGTALEVGGAVAPIALTLGAGAAGQVAGRGALAAAGRAAALTPAGALARGGMAAEAGLARILGGGVAARRAAQVAAAAGEGAVWGLSEGVSEAVLEDKELSAERILAHMKTGALYGGATAGLLVAGVGTVGALGRAAGKVTRAIRGPVPEASIVMRQVDDVERALANPTVREVIDRTPDAPATMQRMMGKVREWGQQRRMVRELPEVQANLRTHVTDNVSRLEVIWDEVQGRMNIARKLKTIGKAFKEDVHAPNAAIVQHADDIFTRAKASVDDVIRNVGEFQGAPGNPISVAKRQLKPFLDEHQFRVRKLLADGATDDDMAKLYGWMDDLKRRFGQARTSVGRRSVAAGIFEEPYLEAQQSLINPEVWGRRVVDIQGPDNKAWTKWFDSREVYEAEVLRKKGGPRSKAGPLGFEHVPLGDPDKVFSAVRRANEGRMHVAGDMLRRNVQDTADLIEQLVKSHRGGPEMQKLAKEARQIADQIQTGMVTAARAADDAEKFTRMIRDAEDIGIPLWGKTLKTAARIAQMATPNTMPQAAARMRAVLAEAGESTVSTAERAAALQQLVRATNGTAKRTSKAAGSFIKLADQVHAKGKRMIAPVAAITTKPAEPIRMIYERKTKEQDEYFDNHPALVARVSQSLGGASYVAPQLSTALGAAAARGVEFLRSKRPTPNIRPSDILAHLDNRQRVSDTEMSKYMRYVDAVENPIKTIEDFGKGQMSREQAEALRAVYPRLFGDLQMQVMEKVAARKESLPYQTLAHLDVLFDRPFHPMFEPDRIRAFQGVFQRTREETQQQAPRRSMPNMAQNQASASQQLE